MYVGHVASSFNASRNCRMLSFKTASPTNVFGQTVSSTFCLLTRCPGFSIRSLRTAKAFGRKEMESASCHKHSLVKSRWKPTNVMSLPEKHRGHALGE